MYATTMRNNLRRHHAAGVFNMAIEGSSDLINWTEEGSALAEDVSNTVFLICADPYHFWRLGRGQ